LQSYKMDLGSQQFMVLENNEDMPETDDVDGNPGDEIETALQDDCVAGIQATKTLQVCIDPKSPKKMILLVVLSVAMGCFHWSVRKLVVDIIGTSHYLNWGLNSWHFTLWYGVFYAVVIFRRMYTGVSIHQLFQLLSRFCSFAVFFWIFLVVLYKLVVDAKQTWIIIGIGYSGYMLPTLPSTTFKCPEVGVAHIIESAVCYLLFVILPDTSWVLNAITVAISMPSFMLTCSGAFVISVPVNPFQFRWVMKALELASQPLLDYVVECDGEENPFCTITPILRCIPSTTIMPTLEEALWGRFEGDPCLLLSVVDNDRARIDVELRRIVQENRQHISDVGLTVAGLTNDMLIAVRIYTEEKPAGSPLYRFFNQPFFESDRSVATVENCLKFLQLLIAAVRLLRNSSKYRFEGTVYRGQYLKAGNPMRAKWDSYAESFKPGTTLRFAPVTSTSQKIQTAIKFGSQGGVGNAPYKILYIFKKTVSAKISFISAFPQEKEVIWCPPSSFVVTSHSMNRRTGWLTVRLQPHPTETESNGFTYWATDTLDP
jgi:hypothetical protein